MRILVVAATAPEIAALVAAAPAHVDVLITGVGMVATAARAARAMTETRYDVAFNFGVCGAFDRALPLGRVCHVVSDVFSELGAQDDERFLSIEEMKLLGSDEAPFTGGRLLNPAPPLNATLQRLPQVRGITVNTVHGHESSIAAVSARLQPQVESMEGAAFMYAALITGTPFAQVRAVSNVVERRNRAAWRLDDAIRNLGETATRMLRDA